MAISFRKKSLEKLSSPEQLDTMIQITNRSGWIALLTVGFCLVVALAWGIYGRIPTKLSGVGILENPKGLLAVKAASSGQLDDIQITLMQRVVKGDLLAVISHPDEDAAVATAEESLDTLENKYQQLQRSSASDLARQKLEIDQEKAELTINKNANQAKIERLEERIESQKELQKLGLITKYDVAETIEELENTRDVVAKDKSQWITLENQYIQAEEESQAKLQDLQTEISEARNQLEEKKVQLKKDAMITAPQTGIVVEFGASEGERVTTDQELFILELESENSEKALLALQYYPAASAKRIQLGMVTQVAPGSVKVDQYGYLLAKVNRISEFPVTSAGLREQVENDEIVQQIEQLGAVLEVQSVLVEDAKTPSGYKWTSSSGPPYQLQVGTVSTTSVIVENTPPIALVVPLIKEYLLGIGEEQQ
jgi:HlyD family secretion protein